jgi:hypothetical protein
MTCLHTRECKPAQTGVGRPQEHKFLHQCVKLYAPDHSALSGCSPDAAQGHNGCYACCAMLGVGLNAHRYAVGFLFGLYLYRLFFLQGESVPCQYTNTGYEAVLKRACCHVLLST